MGYIVCDKCGGYYKLQEGESPHDFELICNFGGDLFYTDFVDDFLKEQQRANVDRKFKQRMEEEKQQKSTNNPSNQYYTNKEFIIILIIGLFVILFFGLRTIAYIFTFFEFPITILLLAVLVIVGLFIFLLTIGTKKY